MRAGGVTIVMPERTVTVPVRTMHLCEVATLREQFDVVLLLVKAYDTRWAAHLIAPYLRDDGLMCGVQNGMSTAVVERHSGPERSWFAVWSIDPAARGREEEIASLLRHSGTVEIVDDIEAT